MNSGINKGQKITINNTGSRKLWIMLLVVIAIAACSIGYWLGRGTDRSNLAGRPVPTPNFDIPSQAYGGGGEHKGDLLITIPPDKLVNAQLKIEMVSSDSPASTLTTKLRTTGTIEPNAYKVRSVLPIVGGIVRQVNVELGDKVNQGQKLVTIFSSELADAQNAYLTMLAESEKHHSRYQRGEKLVKNGLISKQEFESVFADYKSEQAKLNAARQKLLLLGMYATQVDNLSDSRQINPLYSIDAPASGLVLSRTVNTGEVVTMSKELFRITDLSTVWVIGQVYETDFAEVRIGMPVIITAQGYPGKTFTGHISYIDPQVNPQTRTSQIRIEVKNPNQALKLGMYVDVNFSDIKAKGGERVVSIPRSAVQIIGTKHVVFVITNKSGVFRQRDVQVGAESNGMMMIYIGLNAGERIVTDGSFLLRSESLKLNPSQLSMR